MSLLSRIISLFKKPQKEDPYKDRPIIMAPVKVTAEEAARRRAALALENSSDEQKQSDDELSAAANGSYEGEDLDYSDLSYGQLLLGAKSGHPNAQYHLGKAFLEGQGMIADKEEAFNYFKKSSKQHYAPAQYELGELYYQGVHEGANKFNLERRPAVACYLFKQASRRGNALAQYALGSCYSIGDGVKQNPHHALAFWAMAAEQGLSAAQADLGNSYRYGFGTKQNFKKAAHYLSLAAEQNNLDAQCDLTKLNSEAVEHKQVAPLSDERYFAYLMEIVQSAESDTINTASHAPSSLAADDIDETNTADGNAEGKSETLVSKVLQDAKSGAYYDLAHCYAKGRGCEQDFMEACSYLEKAADNGHAQALYELALCYESGLLPAYFVLRSEMEGKQKEVAQLLAASDCHALAMQHLYSAAKLGHEGAQFYLAGLLLGFSPRHTKDQKILCYAHEMVGDSTTESYLYNQLNKQQALSWMEHSANETKLCEAQYALALIYAQGLVCPQDFAKAQKFLNAAAEQKHGLACTIKQLILDMANNSLTIKDILSLPGLKSEQAASIPAKTWYFKGRCVQLGWGSIQDNALAKKYYNVAVQGGSVEAMIALAKLYLANAQEQAYQYLEQAAEAGSIDAMFKLGVLYSDPTGQKICDQLVQGSSATVNENDCACCAQACSIADFDKAFLLKNPEERLIKITQAASAIINGSDECSLSHSAEHQELLALINSRLDKKRGYELLKQAASKGRFDAEIALGKFFPYGDPDSAADQNASASDNAATKITSQIQKAVAYGNVAASFSMDIPDLNAKVNADESANKTADEAQASAQDQAKAEGAESASTAANDAFNAQANSEKEQEQAHEHNDGFAKSNETAAQDSLDSASLATEQDNAQETQASQAAQDEDEEEQDKAISEVSSTDASGNTVIASNTKTGETLTIISKSNPLNNVAPVKTVPSQTQVAFSKLKETSESTRITRTSPEEAAKALKEQQAKSAQAAKAQENKPAAQATSASTANANAADSSVKASDSKDADNKANAASSATAPKSAEQAPKAKSKSKRKGKNAAADNGAEEELPILSPLTLKEAEEYHQQYLADKQAQAEEEAALAGTADTSESKEQSADLAAHGLCDELEAQEQESKDETKATAASANKESKAKEASEETAAKASDAKESAAANDSSSKADVTAKDYDSEKTSSKANASKDASKDNAPAKETAAKESSFELVGTASALAAAQALKLNELNLDQWILFEDIDAKFNALSAKEQADLLAKLKEQSETLGDDPRALYAYGLVQFMSDANLGMEAIEKASNAGLGTALYRLALAYFTGVGKRRNRGYGMKRLEEAAKKGSASAATDLGISHFGDNAFKVETLSSGIAYNEEAGVKLLEQAIATDNNAKARFILGMVKLFTYHKQRDFDGGIKLMEGLVTEGDKEAALQLGIFYNKRKEFDKAFKLFNDLGDSKPLAYFYLGQSYESGRGADKDTKKAIECYAKYLASDAAQVNAYITFNLNLSAEQLQEQQFNLARMYLRLAQEQAKANEDNNESYTEAVNILRNLAAKDHVDALYRLALCYRDGTGVKANKAAFKRNITKAAAAGSKEAQKVLEQLDK